VRRLVLLCRAQQRLLNILVKEKDLGWLPILAKVTLASAGVQREDILRSIFHASCIPAAYSISVVQLKETGKGDRNKKPGRYLQFCRGCVG